MKRLLFISVVTLFFSCKEDDEAGKPTDKPVETSNGVAAPQILNANLLAEYKHDTAAFTQGLQYFNGKLYEGTGDYENSALKIVNLKTGLAEKKHKIGRNSSDKMFGEGITILKDKIYQLTWDSGVVFVYNINNIDKPIQTFKWNSEGWGITNDGTNLIISDGITPNLYFVNPADFKVLRVQSVQDNYGPVLNLNELEYIDGYVFANVWGTGYIVKIDPASGHVIGILHTNKLLEHFYATYPIQDRDNVLNGIAYDSATKKMFITGKRWPKLFEISLN
ncbi:MAG: glutaminyl-peptide cyclotransferase [Chitinophagaceae bacterium]|nr:glutaminyl-peptide cyclotransferase [Chitinophagaceae bacterium]